jgi:hypothetical protein
VGPRTQRTRRGLVATRTLVALAVTVAWFLVVVQPASADTIVWTGNGTNNGFCSEVSQDPNVPPGMQQWLFILTSPGSGPWTLTTDFQNSSPVPVAGVQQGNGSVHFTVLTSAGDQLLSASATNGTANSVLTVSHCETGPMETTTTTTTTTTTPATTTPATTTPATTTPATTTPAAPGAAVAVPVTPRVTG